MIMAGEGIRSGEREKTPVSLIDLAPTLVEMAKAPAMTDTDGQSLVPYLNGTKCNPERSVFSELFARHAWKVHGPSGGPARMLRKGAWKCIYYHNEEPELFNLNDDPQEMNNLAKKSEYQAIFEKMLSEILADWNPQELQIAEDRDIEEVAKIYAIITPDKLEGEYWKGPKDYGWVDPLNIKK